MCSKHEDIKGKYNGFGELLIAFAMQDAMNDEHSEVLDQILIMLSNLK